MTKTKSNGFTLIELLAGMALLAVMILFLTRIFLESSSAVTAGAKRTDVNIAGRTALEFMARELGSAIIGKSNLVMRKNGDVVNVYGKGADEIYFVTSTQTSEMKGSGGSARRYRQVEQVSFAVRNMVGMDMDGNTIDYPNRFRVMRAGTEVWQDGWTRPDHFQSYTNDAWWEYIRDRVVYGQVVAENVRGLDFWIYDIDGNELAFDNWGGRAVYDSSKDDFPKLAAYMDIVLEMLSESDIVRMEGMSTDAEREDYADRVARRFFARVYFDHYHGNFSVEYN